MMTAVAASARRRRRPSQNQPPTDKGLEEAAPDCSDNDGNGKQLEKEENRRIQGSRGLEVEVPEGGDSFKKRKRSAQNDGDGKQKESSAFKQQQVERQQLLRKENRRIKERRGFDFGDIPPIGPIVGRLYEACWAETSLYPAPKVYEDMAKIGFKSYNRQYDASYRFTKILKVYFCKMGNCTVYQIFLQAEDKSVASTEDFKLIVASVPGVTVLSSCMKEKVLCLFRFFFFSFKRWIALNL
ncbi:hypothetical protein RHSIM_Rhsim06G0209600 [Rhododendron simsii]|uniref:Uncharacterized protein n=1 Tax=Rhododendron simsii TaxID=118357 RepID=A0A834GSA7_RHOSS|nr:hypothetical protein RHSIM_Rhsim06G0209600 [Rhododendron simsii]